MGSPGCPSPHCHRRTLLGMSQAKSVHTEIREVVLTLRIWTLAGAGNILGGGKRGVDGGPDTEQGVGVHGTLRIFMSYCSVTPRKREKRSHVWAESPTLDLVPNLALLAPSSTVGSFKQSLAPCTPVLCCSP